MPFIPHTQEDTEKCLKAIGVTHIEALFDAIPKALRTDTLDVPAGLSEMQMRQQALKLANKNQNDLCFVGAGSYEHHIPAAVWEIATRGEYLTAYTPYQAEASQGTLQLLYEFQSLICALTGMEVANASLYDGASALAEAILMSMRLQKAHTHHKILVPETLHPFYQETIQTIAGTQAVEFIPLPFDATHGTLTSIPKTFADCTAIIIPQPNFFGCLEDVDTLTDWAHEHQILVIACVNPLSLALLKPPGEWGKTGADIVCGEGQPLGLPLACGGPYFGFFSTKMAYIRQMPGRLIGRTTDKKGNPGFTLTLQAREQHIRRAKATSNICTNQGLLVTAATIYMCLMGPEGLHQTALAAHQQTLKLVQALTAIPGITQRFDSPFFHEVVLNLPGNAQKTLEGLHQKGILGGYALAPQYPTLKNTLLVCATELRTDEDIAYYAHTLKTLLKEATYA